MKLILKDYQKEGARFIRDNLYCGVFADPGLGKTAITLAIIKKLLISQDIEKVIIIAPLLVCYNVWPNEIRKWDQFRNLTYTILHGKDKEEKLKKKVNIYLINPEGLKWFFKIAKIKSNRIMLVIDESSKFKNPSSVRFKILRKFISKFYRRVILTGTPAPNSLVDLFSQIFIIDAGKTFGQYITHFRRKYFNLVHPKFFIYQPKIFAKEDIERKIKPLVIRFDSKTYLDLPPILYNEIKIRLPVKAEKTYDEIEKQLFTIIGKEEILSKSATTAYRQCHQIANGSLYKPERKSNDEFIQIHQMKLEALENIVDELQGKSVLICYQYWHDLYMIRKHLKVKEYLGGKLPEDIKTKIINRWNTGKIDILPCHPASVSHGLNLQSGGNDLIWFSLTDNLEHYLQMIKRIHRQGTIGQVRIHHIIAQDTVDEAIMYRLKRKEKMQGSLLDALVAYQISKNKKPLNIYAKGKKRY